MVSSLTLVDIVFGITALLLLKIWFKKKTIPLPPGPQKLPIIGNLLDMPSSHAWLTFAEWGAKWGDMVSVSIVGQNFIILNSIEMAVALLDDRSQIYSDRPIIPLGGELVGWNRTLGLSPYGKQFRDYRKYFHKMAGSRTSLTKFSGVIEQESLRFLESIQKYGTQDLDSNIKMMVGASILNVAYGLGVKKDDDPLITLAEAAMDHLGPSVDPGKYLVNLLPALKHIPSWFPGGGFHRTAQEWRKILDDTTDIPYNLVKQKMEMGTATPSFTSTLLGELGMSGDHEYNIKWAAVSFYAGGTDTTNSALNAFFLSMVLNPGPMKLAQQEIDSIVGVERLPTYQDQAKLPYVSALVKELLRWHVLAPMGLPHRVTEDDIYNGYLVPKGSTILYNAWSMARNPQTYSDPDKFNPARFLGAHPERDPTDYVFGFGRRKCPGLLIADASLFITISRVLAMFNISPHKMSGVEVHPVHEHMDGAVSHTRPFQCSISPRFMDDLRLSKEVLASQ